MKRLRAVVRGRVQGVGFRASAATEARRLGLKGFVRNLFDGTVETVAEGEDAAAETYATWLRVGPPLSHVTGVDVEWTPARGDAVSFELK
ncbi:MAG TPA: acylphosphatase [Polyangia bacterium]|nr:acylphosphatase [Polyangia bacterium]